MISILHGLRLLAVATALFGLGLAPASAQGTEKSDYKQIKLDGKMVEGFIAAQKDVADFAQKNPDTQQQSDKPDPKVQAQLDEIAKKHGFASFAEFDDVGFNISVVMGGLDPQTGKFTDPVASLKQEIAEVTADKNMAEKDKKQILDELNEALKNTPPLQYPENVEVVKKYREQIDKVLQ
jgi:surface antigen